MKDKLYLLIATMLSTQLVAQPLSPVVELNNSTDTAVQKKPSVASIQRAEQFYQMQELKDEVKMLRGKVEELTYQLQQIKQLQMDDYLDIDRRLTALASQSAKMPSNPETISSQEILPVNQLLDDSAQLQPVIQIITPEDIEADYSASSRLLKERDFEGAIAAFKNHIVSYEESPYAPNAHYWLGEIYEFRGEIELSISSFETVVENYNSHAKAMDARYKLGKLYYKQGDTKRAVGLLQEAAQSSGGAGAKAKAFLKAKGL